MGALWVRCAEKRLKCDACTLGCARQMESYSGSHRCNVTADDADDGRSPRLRYCLACCQHDECSRVCAQVYASRECQRVRYAASQRLVTPTINHIYLRSDAF